MDEWWSGYRALIVPLVEGEAVRSLAAWLDALAAGIEALAGEAAWGKEDGRALSTFVDDLRDRPAAAGTMLDRAEIVAVLREAMAMIAVRPAYGAHPRVAILGLLESRMAQADLVICGGLNEGSWPATPAVDPLLAPPVLRALGVPGAEFRIGLAAHDLASAMGAPDVLLTRAKRDAEGPTIASRFLLRVRALLGPDLVDRYEETQFARMGTRDRCGRSARPCTNARVPCPPAEARPAIGPRSPRSTGCDRTPTISTPSAFLA